METHKLQIMNAFRLAFVQGEVKHNGSSPTCWWKLRYSVRTVKIKRP